MTLVGPFGAFPGCRHECFEDERTPNGPGRSSRNPPGARIVAEVTRLVATRFCDATGLELDRVEQVMGGKKPVLRRLHRQARRCRCIDDCAEVSRQLSALIEDEEVIRGAFVPRGVVTGPRSGRWHGEDDFRRFAGPVGRHVHATVADLRQASRRGRPGRRCRGRPCVLLDEVKSGERLRVPLDEIAKARLELEALEARKGIGR